MANVYTVEVNSSCVSGVVGGSCRSLEVAGWLAGDMRLGTKAP